jgi:hypothetical protein
VVSGLVLVACGRSSPGERALGTTTDRLSAIRSGDLAMTLLASTADAQAGRGVGFELRGPFAVAERKGELPLADLDYTRVTGTKRRTTKFISTRHDAYVELDGKAYRLDPGQVADLRATGSKDVGKGGLEGLDPDQWVKDPRVAPAGTVDGVAADRIAGKVDAVGALNDVLGLASEFGAAPEGAPTRLEGDAAQEVRRAVRGTRLELLTGRKDRLLRHLRIDVTFGVDQQRALAKALGSLAGVRISLQLDVRQPNRQVSVTAPSRARPASELPR